MLLLPSPTDSSLVSAVSTSSLHGVTFIYIKTRMTTCINAKLKKSDDKTNIDKYRLAANIAEYHIISK